MAAPPQFRPGPPGPGGPPLGPPGAPPPPGGPPMAPGMRPSFPPVESFRSPQTSIGDGHKKKRKNKKKRDDSSSDSEDDECKCPPAQPATQIFITPPGMCMPPSGQNYGSCEPGNCAERGSGQDFDPMKLCMQQCYKGQEDTKTQVICCPPVPARAATNATGRCCCCKSKKSKKPPPPPPCCCQCDGENQRGRKKRPEGTMEGMMPATQQFLMFLQAYGLAAALIRDRNKRDEERMEKEREEKKRREKEEHEAKRKSGDSGKGGRDKSGGRSKSPKGGKKK